MSGTFVNLFKNSKYYKSLVKKKSENTPYRYKWKQTIIDIENAKKYEDWTAIQNSRKELQWLVSLNTYTYQSKVKSLVRQSGNIVDMMRLSQHKTPSNINTEELQEKLYDSYTKADIISPIVLSIDNPVHKQYAEDIVCDFEKTVGQARDNEIPYLESSLLLPKEFTHKALSFYLLCCKTDSQYKDVGITAEYVEELRNKLALFKPLNN